MTVSRARIPLPIKYPGSKSRLVELLVPLMPSHRHYVSVFGGSGADILGKPRSRTETYNDLNGDLCNMFAVLRDTCARRQLLALLECTPYSMRVFMSCLEMLESGECDPVKRAWCCLVLSNQARVGRAVGCLGTQDWSRITRPRSLLRWPHLPEILEQVADRFRTVQVDNLPWQTALAKYDARDTLFYVDPPYLHETRQCKHIYMYELTNAEHQELLKRLLSLQACVMLSGYPSELYSARLGAWRTVSFAAKCRVSAQHVKPPRTEVVWTNFDDNGKRL
jgi:DNA adenine methylase